jgi:Na+/proline symporter
MMPPIASYAANRLVHLSAVDVVIVAFYFTLVLEIGFYRRGQSKSGDDFFMAGRKMTAWVAGLSFLSANLGSSFFIAPLFGTVILGMLWKRATSAGGFWGLLCGTLSSIGLWPWVKLDHSALRYVALSTNAKDMAENMYRALWSWIVCIVVTVLVSAVARPRAQSELVGLVYGVTPSPLFLTRWGLLFTSGRSFGQL